MNGPIAHGTISVAPDTTCLSSAMPVPGFGVLPVNAFLIRAAQPVLVDAGLPALVDATLASLSNLIDPADLRWIWLTHCDTDHLGALESLLELAPKARIVTNYLGMGKLSMRMAVEPHRFYLINPGQSVDVGDRQLRAVSLPSYDAPETMGVFDPRSQALFSADCFGALLQDNDGFVEDAAAIDAGALAVGLATWSTVDAPWLSHLQDGAFQAALLEITRLQPELVLGAHLPPARRMLPWLSRQLEASRNAPPFVGPDQAALEAMMGAVA